jgi:hypothetical protein
MDTHCILLSRLSPNLRRLSSRVVSQTLLANHTVLQILCVLDYDRDSCKSRTCCSLIYIINRAQRRSRQAHSSSSFFCDQFYLGFFVLSSAPHLASTRSCKQPCLLIDSQPFPCWLWLALCCSPAGTLKREKREREVVPNTTCSLFVSFKHCSRTIHHMQCAFILLGPRDSNLLL